MEGRQAAMQRFESCACLGPRGAAPHDHPANLRQGSRPGLPGPAGKRSQGHTVSTDGERLQVSGSHPERGPGGVPDGGG